MHRDLRLYTFSTGTITCPLESIKLNQFADKPLTIPVPWFVITHSQGLVVVDGGNPAALVSDAAGHWGKALDGCAVSMTAEEACVARMVQTGLDPADVRFIIQTHLHADHVGAIAALEHFPKAEVIATRSERHYAAAPDWHLAQDYIAEDICRADGRWILLSDEDDGYDVFGDAVVSLVFTPGHTPGHLSVEIGLPRTGSVILAADAAYTRDHWDQRALPGIVASTVDAVRSVQKLRRLAECRRSLVLYGHDWEQWQAIRHDDNYYD